MHCLRQMATMGKRIWSPQVPPRCHGGSDGSVVLRGVCDCSYFLVRRLTACDVACAGGAGWDLARSLLRPRDGLWCPRPTARQALRHRFLTQSLRWATEPVPQPTKSGKKKAAPVNGKKVREPALAPALTFGWAFGGRPPAAAAAEAASTSGRGGSLPFLNRSRSGPKLADAGAKFDRKVKLKATVVAGRAPQSAVAWSALLPLSTPFNAPAQPAAEAPRALAEPLRGLKRLVGLDAGALPVPPAREAAPPEFPHVAALAQLLRAAQLHQHVPVGLQPLGRPQGGKARSDDAQPEPQRPRIPELGPAARTNLRRVAQIAVPLAAASALMAASGSIVSGSVADRSPHAERRATVR